MSHSILHTMIQWCILLNYDVDGTYNDDVAEIGEKVESIVWRGFGHVNAILQFPPFWMEIKDKKKQKTVMS